MSVLISGLVASGYAGGHTLAATPFVGDSHRARGDREMLIIPDVECLIERFPGVAQIDVDLEAQQRFRIKCGRVIEG